MSLADFGRFAALSSKVDGKHYPTVSLAEVRLKCAEMNLMRANGRCSATEQRERKAEEHKVQQDQNQPSTFTVTDLVELYLTQHIENRKVNGMIISGVRKPKGQFETRRTLYGDAVKLLGDLPAVNVTRKDITNMVMVIIERDVLEL